MTTSRRPLAAEQLERREVPSAVRSIDGSNNNARHADWGTAGSTFLRLAAAEYADGVSAPAGADRPSARLTSNTVADSASTTGWPPGSPPPTVPSPTSSFIRRPAPG